ncbi:unnamed protein product [Prunus armeniaca]|uniref:Uncharacterized protein n=2 Tax=Prunus armeniaca TaxID=36596 RepID=A0A6J5UU24_PRUAR|nr:unnamed protein product [Prunus armeniaca]
MPGMDEEAPMCWCGKAATIRTFWTDLNPTRRFSMCTAKAWFDPAMCERSKTMIPGLLKSRNKLEKSVAKERQREKVILGVVGGFLVSIYKLNFGRDV